MTDGAYSVPEVQRLLATLVASKPGGRVAEIEHLATATERVRSRRRCRRAPPSSPWSSNPGARRGARAALAGTRAEVLEGDWHDLLPQRAPFDFLFADGGHGYDRVVDLLAPGGILVKDDLTPGRPREGDATSGLRSSTIRGSRRPRSSFAPTWR